MNCEYFQGPHNRGKKDSNKKIRQYVVNWEGVWLGMLVGGKYEGNSISKLQIQVATYVFELSAGNCHR